MGLSYGRAPRDLLKPTHPFGCVYGVQTLRVRENRPLKLLISGCVIGCVQVLTVYRDPVYKRANMPTSTVVHLILNSKRGKHTDSSSEVRSYYSSSDTTSRVQLPCSSSKNRSAMRNNNYPRRQSVDECFQGQTLTQGCCVAASAYLVPSGTSYSTSSSSRSL